MGAEFQFCKMESSGEWLHNDVNTPNTTEMSLKDGEDRQYVMCILPQLKIKRKIWPHEVLVRLC